MFEEVGGNTYARHSSDNSTFADRMIVKTEGDKFSFNGNINDFWPDCVVIEEVSCSGRATFGMTSTRLDCEVGYDDCTIDLSKL